MGQELQRLQRRNKQLSKLNQLAGQAESVLVIHYSCESFYDRDDGRTPRITSIAVRNLDSGQTDSFSIHQIAEEEKVPMEDIADSYDMLEKKMLDRYFEFVSSHQKFTWMHWNMRDVNYGFAAIEHRYRVLGGNPTQIAEERKFDLARALVDLYGDGYIGHPHLESLIRKNHISDKDFLPGKEEAAAFNAKQFVKLHQSTLRKVDTLANIFDRSLNNSLETNSSWMEQNGYSLGVISERIKEHWLISLLAATGIILTFIVRAFDLFDKLGWTQK
ncbi:hypothetical protein SIID45300_02296 [Candidatus Magnetaquicoccaceae bacterium FCR-1]|uniref:Uncharacterized protein n=1 Tax=Candidatus Magnetaquiglobus chichijimensis TaxID=3141448 RepID=A0ABQ0CAP1_9PROT